ncbi:MAG: hypothetical protein JF599_12640 [Verrucomicrobia bacterium]|nr:hypothetical protein [Verrucomicrobiota bacterium]
MRSNVEFKDGYAVGFSFAIPECFRDAIERNRFSVGDIFYDHIAPYEKVWDEALLELSISLQVNESLGGRVRFAIYESDSAKKTLIFRGEKTVSEDEFGDILKFGMK